MHKDNKLWSLKCRNKLFQGLILECVMFSIMYRKSRKVCLSKPSRRWVFSAAFCFYWSEDLHYLGVSTTHSHMSGVKFLQAPSTCDCNALVMEKLLPVCSLAVSLAINMIDDWVLSVHENLSHPKSSCEKYKLWKKNKLTYNPCHCCFCFSQGSLQNLFPSGCFSTSHLQSFVLQASATNHSLPPRNADGIFYTDPSLPYVWAPLEHTPCKWCFM